jgi:hypothetical protein
VAAYDWKPPSLSVDKDGQALIRRYSEMKADRYVIMALPPGYKFPQALTGDYKLTKHRATAQLWSPQDTEIILARLQQANPDWKYSKCPDYWINTRDVRRVDLGGVECFDSKAPPEEACWTIYVRHKHEEGKRSGSIGFISAEGKGIIRFADMIRFTSDEIDSVLIHLRELNPEYILDKYYVRKDQHKGATSVSERMLGMSPIIPSWLYKYPAGPQSFPGDTFVIECRPIGSAIFSLAYISSKGYRELDPKKACWFGYQSVNLGDLMPFLFSNNPGWVFKVQSLVHYNSGNVDLLREVGVYKGKGRSTHTRGGISE